MTLIILFIFFWVACGALSYRMSMAWNMANTLTVRSQFGGIEKQWAVEWAEDDSSNLSIYRCRRVALAQAALGPIALMVSLVVYHFAKDPPPDYRWKETLEQYKREIGASQ